MNFIINKNTKNKKEKYHIFYWIFQLFINLINITIKTKMNIKINIKSV